MKDEGFVYLFTSPEGRINRKQWWIGVGGLLIIGFISSLLFGQDGLVPFAIAVLIMVAGIMLHIKRCHDRDKSGWWCLILIIPFAGTIWAIIDLCILEGTQGDNQYGPDPVETWS